MEDDSRAELPSQRDISDNAVFELNIVGSLIYLRRLLHKFEETKLETEFEFSQFETEFFFTPEKEKLMTISTHFTRQRPGLERVGCGNAEGAG